MTREALQDYLETELAAQGDESSISFDEDLTMVGLDSIAFVRLVDFLERESGLRVPPEHVTLENFGTINNIVSYLQRLGDSE